MIIDLHLFINFYIFYCFSNRVVGISVKLDRKQVPNLLFQVCSFWVDHPNDG